MILGTRASGNLTVRPALVVSKHLHDFVTNLISPLGIILILKIMQIVIFSMTSFGMEEVAFQNICYKKRGMQLNRAEHMTTSL